MQKRRTWLAASGAALAAGAVADHARWFGSNESQKAFKGGWVGAAVERGHRLRDADRGRWPAPAIERHAAVLVIGGGIAGLAAARGLAKAGIDDVHIVELEDQTGGNSRGHRLKLKRCPLGAHYLPLPGPDAEQVAELLDSLGLRRIEFGRVAYDERHLCHSPQERLFIGGQWQDGLLPAAESVADGAALLRQYRAFAQRIDAERNAARFTIPTHRVPWQPAHAALDALTFAAWLDGNGLKHPTLRWYLDYCCRDDYGASSAQVSAWAGVHYFASRHGFHAPGDDSEPPEPVLTWPEGNAWLAERLAQPLQDRTHAGWIAARVSAERHQVVVDGWNAQADRPERWVASQVVLAVPLFIAARLIDSPPAALTAIAPKLRYAPWLVANLALDRPLTDRPGPPLAWDNVLYPDPAAASDRRYDGAALGYVDATHQSLAPVADGTVLTAYWALGGDSAPSLNTARAALLNEPWMVWSQRVVADLAHAHPDLPHKLARVDLMRYGHAMSIPVPGVRGDAALAALALPQGRLHFAHADLSAYSVFEEAYGHGCRAAGDVVSLLKRSGA